MHIWSPLNSYLIAMVGHRRGFLKKRNPADSFGWAQQLLYLEKTYKIRLFLWVFFLKSFGGTQLTWLPPFSWIPNLKDLVCVPNCPESAGSIFKIHGFCTQPEFFTAFFTAPWSYLHDLPQTYPLKWPCYTEQYLITGSISV